MTGHEAPLRSCHHLRGHPPLTCFTAELTCGDYCRTWGLPGREKSPVPTSLSFCFLTAAWEGTSLHRAVVRLDFRFPSCLGCLTPHVLSCPSPKLTTSSRPSMFGVPPPRPPGLWFSSSGSCPAPPLRLWTALPTPTSRLMDCLHPPRPNLCLTSRRQSTTHPGLGNCSPPGSPLANEMLCPPHVLHALTEHGGHSILCPGLSSAWLSSLRPLHLTSTPHASHLHAPRISPPCSTHLTSVPPASHLCPSSPGHRV